MNCLVLLLIIGSRVRSAGPRSLSKSAHLPLATRERTHFPFTFGCMIHRFVGIGAFSAAWPSWVIRNFLAAELVKCSIQPFSIIPAIVVEPAGRRFRSKSHSGDMSNCRALRSTWVGMCEGRFGIISLLPSAQALQAGASARWLGWISRIGRRDSRQRVMSA